MVEGKRGVLVKPVKSMLNSTVNPATGGTTGSDKAALHVLAGAVITGAAGKITVLTVLLAAHAPGPAEPAGVVPHAAAKTYLAVIE